MVAKKMNLPHDLAPAAAGRIISTLIRQGDHRGTIVLSKVAASAKKGDKVATSVLVGVAQDMHSHINDALTKNLKVAPKPELKKAMAAVKGDALGWDPFGAISDAVNAIGGAVTGAIKDPMGAIKDVITAATIWPVYSIKLASGAIAQVPIPGLQQIAGVVSGLSGMAVGPARAVVGAAMDTLKIPAVRHGMAAAVQILNVPVPGLGVAVGAGIETAGSALEQADTAAGALALASRVLGIVPDEDEIKKAAEAASSAPPGGPSVQPPDVNAGEAMTKAKVIRDAVEADAELDKIAQQGGGQALLDDAEDEDETDDSVRGWGPRVTLVGQTAKQTIQLRRLQMAARRSR